VVILCALATLLSPSVPVLAQTAGTSAVLLIGAPGDDGMSGSASLYEMRYSNLPIAAGDTLAWWAAAAVVGGMPAPAVAGATDSVVVQNLVPSRTYYFLVRAADEAFNWSGFSNAVIRPAVPDTIPPAPIKDLRDH
jgi:hypothetical protein